MRPSAVAVTGWRDDRTRLPQGRSAGCILLLSLYKIAECVILQFLFQSSDVWAGYATQTQILTVNRLHVISGRVAPLQVPECNCSIKVQKHSSRYLHKTKEAKLDFLFGPRTPLEQDGFLQSTAGIYLVSRYLMAKVEVSNVQFYASVSLITLTLLSLQEVGRKVFQVFISVSFLSRSA